MKKRLTLFFVALLGLFAWAATNVVKAPGDAKVLQWKVSDAPAAATAIQMMNGEDAVMDIIFGTPNESDGAWTTGSSTVKITYSGVEYTFDKYATTNSTNGGSNPANLADDGTSVNNYVVFKPKYDGNVIVALHNGGTGNANKPTWCWEDGTPKGGVIIGNGTLSIEYDGQSDVRTLNDGTAVTGGVKIAVTAGKTYKMTVQGSKARWAGFIYEFTEQGGSDDPGTGTDPEPQAQGEKVIYYHPGTGANSITLVGGAGDVVLTCTGNDSKNLDPSSNITVNGANYKSIKLSNGAQNTLYLQKPAKAITFYSYVNADSGDTYWKEVNGTSYDATTSGGVMESFKDGANPDVRTYEVNGAQTITFTNKGKQLCFVIEVEYEPASTPEPASAWKDIKIDLLNKNLVTEDEAVQWGEVPEMGIAVAEDGTVSRVAVDAEDAVATLSGNWHSAEHGWNKMQLVVPVEAGTYKVTIGKNNFAGPNTFTIKDAAGNETFIDMQGHRINVADTKGDRYAAGNENTVLSFYYQAAEATTVTILNTTYTGYVAIEAYDGDIPDEPNEATITFAMGDVTAEGTVPQAVTVDKGATYTIPVNHSLYVEGKTLTAWTDGTNNYAIGQEITLNEDLTVTPVFTDNTVSLDSRTAETVVVFDFQRQNGSPEFSMQGGTGLLVAPATIAGSTIDMKMTLDATAGKIANSIWVDWCQMNAGTKLTIPAVSGMKVAVAAYYSTLSTTTVGGVSENTDCVYTWEGTDSTIDIVIGDDAPYWRSFTVTYPAPVTIDVVVAPESGADIAEAVAAAVAEKNVKSLTVNLAKDGQYTVKSTIEASYPVAIVGDEAGMATIDASELSAPMLRTTAIPADGLNGKGVYEMPGAVGVKNVKITGLKQQLYYANKQKVWLKQLYVVNSIIAIEGATKKTIFDFNGGGNAEQVLVENSTIYSDEATQWQNGGFYSTQSGGEAGDYLDSTTDVKQKITINNSTIYRIASSATTATRRRNSQAYLLYEVKNSVIVNSGKQGQFIKGLNAGQNGKAENYDVDNISVQWITDGAYTDITATEAFGGTITNPVEGAIEFAGNPAEGDFTLTNAAPQNVARIGDPRWHVALPLDPAIVLDLESGKDIATELAAVMGDLKPESITINLAAAGQYTISAGLPVGCALVINGDAEQPATIDASQLTEPFVNLSTAPHELLQNEKGAYAIDEISFNNVSIKGLPRQLVYANKVKYLVGAVNVVNSVIELNGAAKKTTFDFNGGGNTAALNILNSTIWGNPAVDQNGGFFSSQSGQEVTDLGGTITTTTILNSTLVNITPNRTVSTLRKNSQAHQYYVIKDNIIVNSGKQAQFIKGLNSGGNGRAANLDIDHNSFQWASEDGYTDIAANETCAGEIKNNVEGVITFKGNPAEGDFTLGNECAQNVEMIGDPRWLSDRAIVLYLEDGDIAEALNEAFEENATPTRIEINLAPAAEFTLNSSIVTPVPFELKGDAEAPAFVNASANSNALILLSAEPQVAFQTKTSDGSNTDYYAMDYVKVSNVVIDGVKGSILYDNNKKYVVNDLTIDNVLMQLNTQAVNNEAYIAMQQGGIKDLTITNSTIYSVGQTNAKYFQRYNNSARLDRYGYDGAEDTWSFTYENNTFYKVSNGGQWGNYNGVGGKTAQMIVKVNNNIWYDCADQVLRRLFQSKNFDSFMAGSEMQNNTFWKSASGAEDQGSYGNGTDLAGDPGFLDAENGDFTLDARSKQANAHTGDPRWRVDPLPGMPIVINAESGADLAALLETEMAANAQPESVTINLAKGGSYTVSKTMPVGSNFTIKGADADDLATIDASQLAGPMLQIEAGSLHESTLLENGYHEIELVQMVNTKVTGLAQQLFYANKQKVLIDKLLVENDIVQIAGGNKTTFDSNGGGVIAELAITKSTLYANPQHTGQLYSSQSGAKATEANVAEQLINIKYNTLYNISYGKNVMTHRQASQTWLAFEVMYNIVVDCGKEGQFLKGLNNGQGNANPRWKVYGNAFQRTKDGAIVDIAASESTGDEAEPVKGNIEGDVIFVNNIADGDFTLGDCVQGAYKIGDPRWTTLSATDIAAAITNIENGQWYNIQGMRIAEPTKAGLYIHNGKKVVIK